MKNDELLTPSDFYGTIVILAFLQLMLSVATTRVANEFFFHTPQSLTLTGCMISLVFFKSKTFTKTACIFNILLCAIVEINFTL